MSEPASKYEQFGFDADPFSVTIATEEIASRYELVGRDEQEYQLDQFVDEGIRDSSTMKKRLIFGEYGTGKSHHLIQLRDEIRTGVEVDDDEYQGIAVYVENLGFSIRRLYEKIVEEIKESAPELQEYIESLPSIEPEESVDDAYQYERLRDNIADHLRKIAQTAQEDHGYRAVFIFIDEAEDIANPSEDEKNKLPQFIRSFLHIVNSLNAAGVHMLLGFSQGARMRITSYEEDEDTLGNALMQRFQGGEIYLGDLTADDVKEMLIDRMDQHRTTGRGDLAPIAEETVSVVTDVTGGHPREILRIYSQALEYATELDQDRVDGDAIVYALTGFKSFVRDEELLSQEAITALKNALEDVHPDARDDFERLQGRLIGEDEVISEDVFSNGVPGALVSPITVESDESRELRVLEQREQHGRRSYLLSEEARDFLFSGAGGEGTEIQKLDFRASNASDKYQQELSRGVALALQDTGHGNLHKNPVSQALDRYEYSLRLIDIKRGAGKRDQTVAVGVYNGQEIPEESVELYVEAIRDHGASFGVLVKENQQLSASANKYLNDLDAVEREYYQERVVEVDLSTEQRDNLIYGRLLALGDTETNVEELVDERALVDEFGIVDDLETLFEEVILPYPDSVYRQVIDRLESEDSRSFSIGDLRDELDLEQYELNEDIMEGLRSQSLVVKDSRRWTYPDIESDRPPWYEIYRLLNDEDTELTISELRDRLASEYVFDCPSGDEHAMFQWYLDHLQRQNYVEPNTVTRDGKTVEAYHVVSVSDQYNEARTRAENQLETARDLYDQAVSLNADGVNSYENRLDDLDEQLDTFDEVFDPDHSDLTEIRDFIDDVIALEEDLEEGVEEQQESIVGDARNLRDHQIDAIQSRIRDAEIEGSFAAQLQDFDSELTDLHDELDELIESEQFERLRERSDAIEDRIGVIEEEVEDILEIKSQCTEKYREVRDLAEEAREQVGNIAEENETRADLEERVESLDTALEEYQDTYNSGDYKDALAVLTEEAQPLAEEIEQEAGEIVAQQQQYLSQLDDLETEVDSTEGAEKIADARSEVKAGNFADAPLLIDDIEEFVQGPTRREQFMTALRDHDGSLATVIQETDFDGSEAFTYLNRCYTDGEIDDVQAVIDDE